MMAECEYTLSYFNTRGLAEPIRLLLIDQGIPFEDDQFSKEGEWFLNRKAHTVFGRCPTLVEGGVQIAESGAIIRHLARKHHLYGETEAERTLLDMVADGLDDLRNKYYQCTYFDYENKAAFLSNELPPNLTYFENIFGSRSAGSKYILGDKIGYTDYMMWELLECLAILSAGTAFDKFPHLKAYHYNLPTLRPKMQAYLSSEKRQKLQVNSCGRQ